jgi:Amt family ammonium transporter
LVAQLIGIGTLVGGIFTLSYVAGWIMDVIIGQRASAADELEGLDIPEMGALCYPEFVLKPEGLRVPSEVAAD